MELTALERCVNIALSKGLYSDINSVVNTNSILVRIRDAKTIKEDLPIIKKIISEMMANGCITDFDTASSLVYDYSNLERMFVSTNVSELD